MNFYKPVPALFLHIQKTAGTSIVNVARQYYGESVTSHGDCWAYSPDELEDVAFVSGHIGYDYARSLMPSRYSFVFLRDPVERILSMYYFCRKQDENEFLIYKSAHEHELEEFLEAGLSDSLVKKNIWNNQVWQLAHGYGHLDDRRIDDFDPEELIELALAHLDAFDYVGFTETFDMDRNAVLKALGIPSPEHDVVENITTGRPSAQDLSASAMELLEELTILDRALYQEARSRHRLLSRCL